MPKDFLDEIVEERTRRNPDFPNLVEEALWRREVARRLAEQRKAGGLSQTIVAARMGTAASVVSKLESGGDVKLSTLQRYCAAVGGDLSAALAKFSLQERGAHSKRTSAHTSAKRSVTQSRKRRRTGATASGRSR